MRRLGASACAATAAALLTTFSVQARAIPPHWDVDSLEIVVDETVDELGPGALDAVIGAASAWQQVPTGMPTVTVAPGEAAPIGYDPEGPNANTVHFVSEGEPLARGALAITIATYNQRTGRLVDADIVLNGVHRFGDVKESETRGVFDLQSVLTHELGHALGLTENYGNPDATMFASSKANDARKRTLGADDREALTQLYGAATAEVDSPQAEGPYVQYGCSATGNANGSGPTFVLACLLGAAVVSRRRRPGRAALAAAVVLPTLALSTPGWTSPTTGPAHALDDAEHECHPSAGADAVAGSVVEVDARWDGGLIVTDVVVETDEGVREVRVLGGRQGDLVQVVAGRTAPPVGARIALPAVAHPVLLPTELSAHDGSPADAKERTFHDE